MPFKTYTISATRNSSKMAVVLVLGFMVVLAAVSFIMFYLGRQSVIDALPVTP